MLDHDDELEPDALSEVIRLLTEDPGLDAVTRIRITSMWTDIA